MGRGESEGSVYQIGSGPDAGKWRGAVVVAWKPDGTPVRRTVKRATEKEAKRALRDLLNDRDRGRLPTNPAMWKLSDWLAHWLEKWRQDKDRAESTYHRYLSTIRGSINPAIGDVRLDQFAEKHYRKALDDELAGSTNRHVYIVLNQAMKLAVKDGVRGHNPLEHVKPPAVARRELDVPEKEDVVALLDAAAARDDHARWVIALDLGLRQGEALGIDVDRDVDLDRRTLVVTHQLRRVPGLHACGEPTELDVPNGQRRRWAWPCGHTWAKKCPAPGAVPGRITLTRVKSRAGRRTVPITDELVPLLQAQIARRERDRRMLGSAYRGWRTEVAGREREVHLLFAQRNGRPVEPHDDWEAWRELLKAAGLTQHRLHAARHAAVVNMIDSGVPIKWVSEIIGHSSTAFTQDVYGHYSDDAADAARERISAGRARTRDAVTAKRRGRIGAVDGG